MGEVLNSCALEACIQKGREMIGWEKKFPCVRISDTKVRAVGAAITMQGSSIPNIDMAAVEVRLQDDAYYTLMIGATDMGTGCDTILAQIAAQCLECELDKIIVNGVDTDHSPYDTGSYASSTTFLTGMAVVKACERLKIKIIREAATRLSADPDTLTFDGRAIFNDENSMDLDALARELVVGAGNCLSATASHSSPVSPPPFMAGFAEIEMDLETGKTHVIDYVGVVDCGTSINPNLARIQTEGGIVQGIGMALFEDITYGKTGKMMNKFFMQYKTPSPWKWAISGLNFKTVTSPPKPFGAKSIGEGGYKNPRAPAICPSPIPQWPGGIPF